MSLQREMNTIMYRMPCKEAKELQFDCPPGYYLDKVRLEHAELIDEHWSARHPGSLRLIQMLIEHNTSAGLFHKETGQLCAWCLRWHRPIIKINIFYQRFHFDRLQSGFLGALEVLQTHQRRGLGAVVAAAISQRIANELNHDVTALVNLNNAAACKLFNKLSFTLAEGEHYYWSMCLPERQSSISWQANHWPDTMQIIQIPEIHPKD